MTLPTLFLPRGRLAVPDRVSLQMVRGKFIKAVGVAPTPRTRRERGDAFVRSGLLMHEREYGPLVSIVINVSNNVVSFSV